MGGEEGIDEVAWVDKRRMMEQRDGGIKERARVKTNNLGSVSESMQREPSLRRRAARMQANT